MIKETLFSAIAEPKRLGELANTELVMEMVKGNEPEFARLLENGWNELITRFNRLTPNSPELEIMPGARALVQALEGKPLPEVARISARELIVGIREAREPMIAGQRIRRYELEASRENVAFAIGTPSMDTTPRALLVGTAGHLLERSLFAYLEARGVSGVGGRRRWHKDEILHALEDCLLLMNAEATMEGGLASRPILLDEIAQTNKEGGLGWRTPEQLQEFITQYRVLVMRGFRRLSN
jgi:hypothetical protein